MLLNVRIKIVLLGLLLFLALSTTVFAARSTYSAVQHLQQQNALVRVGDVHSIRSWMTIPYIAHLYHVPASYLYHALHVPDTPAFQHLTLHALSLRYKRPVNDLIRELQNAIETYRRQHTPPGSSPGPDHVARRQASQPQAWKTGRETAGTVEVTSA